MKGIKKILLVVIAFCIFISIFNINSNAASGDLLLKNLDFKANIKEDGSMDVIETWNIYVKNTNTLFKTFILDNSRYSGISNVKVVEQNGSSEIPYTNINEEMHHVNPNSYYGLKNKKGLFEIAWGADMEKKKGNKTYKISYKVNDAISKYNDYAELYWQFVGKDFEVSSQKITGTITLPQNVQNKEDIKVWGHVESLNGTIYPVDTNKIEFNIDNFKNGQYIEIRTLFPTNLINSSNRTYNKDRLNEVLSEETVWANDANKRRENQENQEQIKAIIFIIAFIIVDILLVIKLIKYLRKYKNTKKILPSIDIKYYREIPDEKSTPMEATTLLIEKVNIEDPNDLGKIFSATLLNLALKNKISFEKNINNKGKEEIIIKKLDDNIQNLQKDEQEIYSFILQANQMKNENMITTKELERYIKQKSSEILALKVSLNEYVEETLKKKEYFTEDKKNEKIKYLALSSIYIVITILTFILISVFGVINNNIVIKLGISVVLVSILNIIAVILVNSKLTMFTQKGIDEKAKWVGLKNFMEDFSMLDKREVPELILWEKYLVYATAFGIAKKVIKQLKIVYPNFDEVMNMNTAAYMYLMIHTDFSTTFSNSISSAITSTYSSASGGGGGFSGGGGGGRWPEEVEVVDKIYHFFFFFFYCIN